jgi:hypothetical protein
MESDLFFCGIDLDYLAEPIASYRCLSPLNRPLNGDALHPDANDFFRKAFLYFLLFWTSFLPNLSMFCSKYNKKQAPQEETLLLRTLIKTVALSAGQQQKAQSTSKQRAKKYSTLCVGICLLRIPLVGRNFMGSNGKAKACKEITSEDCKPLERATR